MVTVNTLKDYDEYVVDCYYEGRTPVTLWAWINGEE